MDYKSSWILEAEAESPSDFHQALKLPSAPAAHFKIPFRPSSSVLARRGSTPPASKFYVTAGDLRTKTFGFASKCGAYMNCKSRARHRAVTY